MFPLQNIAKALIGAAVTAGAAYVGTQFHVVVPADVQSWVTDTAGIVVAGLIGGGLVYRVPNAQPVQPQKRGRKAK
jgi:hypothetical protein